MASRLGADHCSIFIAGTLATARAEMLFGWRFGPRETLWDVSVKPRSE